MQYLELDEKFNNYLLNYNKYPVDLLGYKFFVEVGDFLVSNGNGNLPEPKNDKQKFLFDLARHVEGQFKEYKIINLQGGFCTWQYLKPGVFLPYGWENLKEFNLEDDSEHFKKLIELYFLERLLYQDILDKIEPDKGKKQTFIPNFLQNLFELSKQINIKLGSLTKIYEFWSEVAEKIISRVNELPNLGEPEWNKCELLVKRILAVFEQKKFISALTIWLKEFEKMEDYFPIEFFEEYDNREKTFEFLKNHYFKELEKKFPNPPKELIKDIINTELKNVKAQTPGDRIFIESEKNENQLYNHETFLSVNKNAKLKAEFLFIKHLKGLHQEKEVPEFDVDAHLLSLWACIGADIGVFNSEMEGFRYLQDNVKVIDKQTHTSLAARTQTTYKTYFKNEVKDIRNQLKELKNRNKLLIKKL